MAEYGHAQRGEVLALDRNRLRLALWQGTVTTGNLLRTGQGTLVAIHDGAAHYVRSPSSASRSAGCPASAQRFDAQVVAVREDIAKYADIISAVKFQRTTRKESCALEGNAGGIAKVNVYALKRAGYSPPYAGSCICLLVLNRNDAE